MAEELHEQVFEVSLPARLDLDNIRGSIVIRPQDSAASVNTLIVKAVKDLDSGDGERTTIEMSQREDGQVVVRTRYASQEPPGFQQIKRKPCIVNYSIQIPKECSLKVEAVSSSIDIEKLAGEFTLKTVSGSVDVRELSGEIKVESISGKISAEGLSGRLNCENVSGSVKLEKSEISALEARTVSGEILAQITGQAGPYHFHTISGDLTLILSEDQGASINLQSLSGKLHLHHPDGTASQKGSRDLALQGGGPRIRFDTVSGDMHLTTPELYQAELTASQEESATNQHEVLASVASGEMTAEEGLQALKG